MPEFHVVDLSAEPAPQPEHKYLAPWWHTAGVLLLLGGLSVSGYLNTRKLAIPNSTLHPTQLGMLLTYAGTFIFEWALFLFVRWGERRYHKTPLAARVGGRWDSAGKVWTDIGLGAGIWFTLFVVGATTNSLLKPKGAAVLAKLLPKTIAELALFALIAASAGFCEEYVFRGYLLNQFRILTGSVWIAVVIQAAIFGVSHGYQGAGLMVSIFLYGVILGTAARWRKSLRPCMIAHGSLDFISGFAGYVLHLLHRI